MTGDPSRTRAQARHACFCARPTPRRGSCRTKRSPPASLSQVHDSPTHARSCANAHSQSHTLLCIAFPSWAAEPPPPHPGRSACPANTPHAKTLWNRPADPRCSRFLHGHFGREGGARGPAGQGPPHLPAALPAGEAPARGPRLGHPHQRTQEPRPWRTSNSRSGIATCKLSVHSLANYSPLRVKRALF